MQVQKYFVSHINLHLSSCLFQTAAPADWNSLPSTIRSFQTLKNTFLKYLKTHLFQSAFNSP